MSRIILSATVGEGASDLRFQPGINILWGKNAEDVLLTLAGIFGGMPTKAFQAVLHWRNGVTFFVSGEDGHVFVNKIKKEQGDSAQWMKKFHKQRFLNFRNYTHIFDGTELLAGTAGASELLLKKLEDALKQEDDRPLFVYNFLERLDEAVDLQPIFDALNATGRQIFIAVPDYNMEVRNYGASTYCESNFRKHICKDRCLCTLRTTGHR